MGVWIKRGNIFMQNSLLLRCLEEQEEKAISTHWPKKLNLNKRFGYKHLTNTIINPQSSIITNLIESAILKFRVKHFPKSIDILDMLKKDEQIGIRKHFDITINPNNLLYRRSSLITVSTPNFNEDETWSVIAWIARETCIMTQGFLILENDG